MAKTTDSGVVCKQYKASKASEIGPMLKAVRKDQRLTQVQLTKIFGRSRGYIAKAEREGGSPTLKALIEIAEKGLGCRVDILFDS